MLRYPKLASVFSDPDGIVTLISTVAETVHPSTRLAVVADEPDDRVLEAAETGQADAIVTGDAGLLALHAYQEIRLLTTVELLALLGNQSFTDRKPP